MNRTESPLPPRAAPRRATALVLLLFVFLAGALCGAGGGLVALRSMTRRALADPSAAGIRHMADRLEAKIAREARLDPGEREAVRRELDAAADRLRALKAETLDANREAIGDAVARIGEALPQEKKEPARQAARAFLAPWHLFPEEGGEKSPPGAAGEPTRGD